MVDAPSLRKPLLDEPSRLREHLDKAKKAVKVLEKARTDPVVRGAATPEYVEDRWRRGKVLVQRLEERLLAMGHKAE